MRTALALGVAAALTVSPAASQPGGSVCPGEFKPDRLKDLIPQGDIVLASAGSVKLAGIRIPDESPIRGHAHSWLRERLARDILFQSDGQRDRWNRHSARIRLADTSLDLGHALVEAGLALVDPGTLDSFCQPELLALEETARERKLGLWADGRYNPIDAEQTDLLRERIGTFVLVEGRVRSVGERERQTYLNFGGNWAEDFTIIVPRKVWNRMTAGGLGSEALKGRRIRARGILQPWQGTALTVVIPQMIERLESRR